MAKNSVDRRNAAREKARQIAQAQAAREKRAKTILWSGVGVVVLAVVAVVVLLVVQSMRPAVAPSTFANGGITLTKADQGTTVVAGPDVSGDAANGLPAYNTGQQSDKAAHVDVYLDFQCPICKSFEDTNGDAVTKLLDQGDATVTYHPVSILDSMSGGNKYSTRAANAFMCAADAGQSDKLIDFMQTLFTNQPAEGGSGMTDDQLLGFMTSSGIDVNAKTKSVENQPTIQQCVADVNFEKYVGKMTQEALDNGLVGTPRILVNGNEIDSTVWSDEAQFGQKLLEASGQINANQ